jgi:hypothetical protein
MTILQSSRQRGVGRLIGGRNRSVAMGPFEQADTIEDIAGTGALLRVHCDACEPSFGLTAAELVAFSGAGKVIGELSFRCKVCDRR